MLKAKLFTMIVVAIMWLSADICFGSRVVKEGNRVFIEDNTGERWDVTQALTLGFKPHRFQYGIGRDAFTPLRDEDLADDNRSSSFNTRIIGISINNKAHAYAVDRLRNHETANTTIDGEAIVAGY